MAMVSARLPEDLVRDIDEAARSMNRSRIEVIRAAVEHFMSDVDGHQKLLDSFRIPVDLTFDWDEIENTFLEQE